MKPLVTMPDVLLACGELNKRERVAVQWVIDRYERERSAGLTVEEAMEAVDDWLHAMFPDSNHIRHPLGSPYRTDQHAQDTLRARLTAALTAKSRKDEA